MLRAVGRIHLQLRSENRTLKLGAFGLLDEFEFGFPMV
jgi:hypothetical protein